MGLGKFIIRSIKHIDLFSLPLSSLKVALLLYRIVIVNESPAVAPQRANQMCKVKVHHPQKLQTYRSQW